MSSFASKNDSELARKKLFQELELARREKSLAFQNRPRENTGQKTSPPVMTADAGAPLKRPIKQADDGLKRQLAQ
eukprot:906423-Rhodomonas_salina.1